MRFCEQLNEYITRLDCRGKELAEAAGLSAPSLSRYRTGERTPGRGSAVLTALSDALAISAKASLSAVSTALPRPGVRSPVR